MKVVNDYETDPHYSWPQWRNGEPTDAGVRQFTTGDCWVLAWSLYRRTQMPIVGLCESEDQARHAETFHVLNVAPNGFYFDVNGFSSLQALRNEWLGGDPIYFASERTYVGDHWLEGATWIDSSTWTYPHATRRAGVMADRLIAKYNLTRRPVWD